MLIKKMFKIIRLLPFTFFLIMNVAHSNEASFNTWLNDFKKKAIETGISKVVVNDVMSGAKFLPKVIEYDRYQPEFYEDTFTYIKKRTSKKKIKEGLTLYKKQKKIIDKVETESVLTKEEVSFLLKNF